MNESAAMKIVKGSLKNVHLAESLFPQLRNVYKILAPPLSMGCCQNHIQ